MSRLINFQTISWFWDLYQRDLLDLDPPYQRRSVWNQAYKDYFIDTVLNNYPAPAIFIYQDISPEGKSKFSIVDGKQRLSTLFEFVDNKFPVSEDSTIQRFRGKYFKDLAVETKQDFWKYQFAIEYLPSNNENIIGNIFDRINRNVIKLTPQELRHAKFDGIFISTIEELTTWMFNILNSDSDKKIFPNIDSRTKKQMKDVEMVAQLVLFLEEGVKAYSQDYLNKAFSDRDIEWVEKEVIEEEFRQTIKSIKDILDEPLSNNINLANTRLKNQADFYSFFGAVAELNRENKLKISKKSPDSFIFDSTRINAKLKQPPDFEIESGNYLSIYDIIFEIQIKSAFEHAWSVATHDLVYKSDEIDWRRFRLAAQLKATVEQLDTLILAFEETSKLIQDNNYPDIKVKRQLLTEIKKLFNNKKIPEELQPKDMSRFCENLFLLLEYRKDKQVKQLAIINKVAIKIQDTPSNKIPRSISLFQYFFAILIEEDILELSSDRYYCHITDELKTLYPHI